MRYLFLFGILIALSACRPSDATNTGEAPSPYEDNEELEQLVQEDQADRQGENIDWDEVRRRDSLRRARVNELIESGEVSTSRDYFHAAMIFQHGTDSTHYRKASKYAQKALELNPRNERGKWLMAASHDRYLLSIGKKQIYGTQMRRRRGECWSMAPFDSTKVTDEERMELGVRTLAESRKRQQKLNAELTLDCK